VAVDHHLVALSTDGPQAHPGAAAAARSGAHSHEILRTVANEWIATLGHKVGRDELPDFSIWHRGGTFRVEDLDEHGVFAGVEPVMLSAFCGTPDIT
jgi:hypothetical protein